MEKRPDALIEIALRALRQARKFLGGRTLAAYLADDQCQSAVERQLEIAGDALGGLRKLDAAQDPPTSSAGLCERVNAP